MSLNKSTVPVVFQGGLDQKTAEKIRIPGKFIALENAVFRKAGELEKRYGFTGLTTNSTGTALSSGTSATESPVGELVVTSNARVYSYSPGLVKWADRGAYENPSVSVNNILNNSVTATVGDDLYSLPDVAYGGGFIATVAEYGYTPNMVMTIQDATTRAVMTTATIGSSLHAPRIVATADGFVLGGHTTGTTTQIYYLAFTNVGISAPALVTTITSVDVARPWDMASYGTGTDVFVGYTTTSPTVGVAHLNSTGTFVASQGFTGNANLAIAVVPDSTRTQLYVLFADATFDTRAKRITTALVEVADTAIDTTPVIANQQRNITGVVVGASLYVFIEHDLSTTPTYRYTKSARINATNALVDVLVANLKEGFAGLASKAFSYNSNVYITLTRRVSEGDGTLYLFNTTSGKVVSRFYPGRAGGLSETEYGVTTYWPAIPSVFTTATGVYSSVFTVTGDIDVSAFGVLTTPVQGVDQIAFDFTARPQAVNYGRATYYTGGCPMYFDGDAMKETDGHHAPKVILGTKAAGALTGDLLVSAVYEYTNLRGEMMRSPPAAIQTTALGAQKIMLHVEKPSLSSSASAVRTVLYISEMDGTVLYKIYALSVQSATYQNCYQEEVNYVPNTNAELLYTTGGILENAVIPATTCLASYRQRLFAASAEGPDLYFSKKHVTGESALFIDGVTVPYSPTGGLVYAMAELDEKLILFKKASLYMLVGDGPTDAGGQSDYQDPQLIASDVGTTNRNSVISTPKGIFFKSGKGIYLLNRGLGLEYVGAPVEDYNAQEITSAVIVEDQNEVRFTTAASVCLVYNYEFRTWSVFTNYAAVGACMYRGAYGHLTSAGVYNVETSGSYADNGTRVVMRLETSWLSFAGIQGFQRIYKVTWLGKLISNHTTQVRIAYDFETTYNETIPYATTALTTDVYQVENRPARQKCEAIKFEISDSAATAAGGSFKLNALTCEIGRKQGTNKLPNTKRAGS